MARLVAAYFIGLIAVFVCLGVGQSISLEVYPPPEVIEPGDTEAWAAYLASAPTGAILGILFSYVLAAFFGPALATAIGRKKQIGLFVGWTIFIFGLLTLFKTTHPTWFAITSTVVILPTSAAGCRWSTALREKRQQEASSRED